MNADGVLEHHLPPGMEGKLDVRPLLSKGGFSVVGEGMGWLYEKLSVGTYEVHTAVLPEYRGPRTLNYALESVAHAFMETDCMELITRCPENNKPAIKLAKAVGGTHLYDVSGVWGDEIMHVYSLTLNQWAASAKEFIKKGEWVHDQFGDEDHADHDYDALHMQYAGICADMALAGKPEKAVHVYNVWAQMSGYAPIELLSRDPIYFRFSWLNKSGVREEIDYSMKLDKLEKL